MEILYHLNNDEDFIKKTKRVAIQSLEFCFGALRERDVLTTCTSHTICDKEHILGLEGKALKGEEA